MANIKIVSQKIISRSKLFDVLKTKLELSNGSKRSYESIKVRSDVFIFPLLNKDEIYLIDQYRYLQKGRVLQAVAGFVEDKETSVQAAKRELKEETGLTAFNFEELLRVELANSVVKSLSYLFLAKDLEEGEQSLTESEDIKLVKISLADAIKKIFSGEIIDAKTIVGLFLLDKLKREKKL
ncbi:MAG: NUDIX hydrolase [Candidatus Levyibacteriota bacterium]